MFSSDEDYLFLSVGDGFIDFLAMGKVDEIVFFGSQEKDRTAYFLDELFHLQVLNFEVSLRFDGRLNH